MQYLGGKSGSGKEIARICTAGVPVDMLFVDMFCGALNVVRHVKGRPRRAIDGNQALITMWRAAQKGWVPPIKVGREQYDAYKATRDPLDPMTAFVLFGVSFGGKWCGGYAKDRPQQRYAECASNGIVKKIKDCHDVKFDCLDFRKLAPGGLPRGTILYCDPPYVSTTGYAGMGVFPTQDFWEWAEAHAKVGVKVFVSENQAPSHWRAVATFEAVQGGRLVPGKAKLVDKLFSLPLK